MDFPSIITFILNFIKKTLQVELNNFNKIVSKLDIAVSKAAFSKARNRISYTAFKELFELTSKLWLESDEYQLYKNHRIFAIDGSFIQLENNKELLNDFGYLGANDEACRGRASILCEVLDGVVIHSSFDSVFVDERTLAKEHIAYFDEYARKNDILIFDRGYPSKEFIALFADKKWKYLMRVQKSFQPIIDKTHEPDFYITIRYNKNNYKVRVLKFPLSNGEIETLITNISEDAFKKEDFIDLYYKR